MDRALQNTHSMRSLSSRVLPFLAALALAAGAAGCSWGVDGGGLDPLTPADHERYFPIAVGNHAELTCVDCHGAAESFREFTCVSCHEHSQELMDPTHLGFPDYLFDSPRCLTCHPRGNVLEEVEHDFFPIRGEAAAHEGISCASCHTDPANRKAVTCTGCHEHAVAPMAEMHNHMPDYLWSSPACLTCHPNSQPVGLLDHSSFFPIESGSIHEQRTCADCHTNQRDRTELGCITCHEGTHDEEPMADVHNGIPEYLWESASCFLCHPNAEHEGAIQHERWFPIATGQAHEVGRTIPDADPLIDATTIECASCHYDETDRSAVGCTDCHTHRRDVTDLTHTSIPDYAYESASCLFCHPNGDPTGYIQHDEIFPISLGTPHGDLECSDCHVNENAREDVACIACHEHDQAPMATVHQDIPGYTWDSPSCIGCHPNGAADGAIDHTFFPIGAGTAHEPATCNDCHIQPDDRSVVGCTGCHEHGVDPMGLIHAGMPDYLWDSPSCLTCHPSGQPVGLLDHTGFFPIELGTTHDHVECASCHIQPDDRTELGCIECHEGEHDQGPMNAAHDGVPAYQWQSSSCFLCHQQAQVPGEIDHEAFFPIVPPAAHADIACNECHTNPTNNA